MPCRTDDWPTPTEETPLQRQLQSAERQLAERDAMLCAVCGFLESQKLMVTFFDYNDWKESGVKREFFENWWKHHSELDRRRRAEEAYRTKQANLRKLEKQTQEKLRKQALSKLTQQEISALKIKLP